MQKLSKRLSKIYDFVDAGSVVFDIGADHGKLIIELVRNHKISHGYANENKKGPYNILLSACQNYPNIAVLFSDGIDNLPIDVDTLVLAGMGGHLIVNILTKHQEKLKQIENIIVDAHTDIRYIREKLSSLSYEIVLEDIVLEKNVYYEIIKFQRCSNIIKYEDDELNFGPLLLKAKPNLFKEKYQKRIHTINSLLKIENLSSYKINKLKKEKDKLEEIINEH